MDAILAGVLFELLLVALLSAVIYGTQSGPISGARQRAVLLAEEGLEAARNIRDENFGDVSDGTHGLQISGNEWTLSGTSDTTDVFTRALIVSTIDSNTKSVTATVSWQQNPVRTGSVSLATYLTNWLESVIGNWTAPFVEGSLDLSGNDDGMKVQISGDYAYVVRNGGVDFVVVDVSTSSAPSMVGSLSLSGTLTNIAVSGNYAYVSSTDNSSELQVIDISTPSAPTQIGTYNASGNADATGVFVSGSSVYLVRASSTSNEFFILSAAVPSAPTLVGSLDLGAQGNEVAVLDSYAYVASASNTQELQVIDITVPALPTLAGSLNLSGNTDASSIALASGVVALGRADNLLYMIDIFLPTTPATLGSTSAGTNVNDVAFGNSDTYIFLAANTGAGEFRVYDVSAPATPSFLGSYNHSGTMSGVAYDSARDRAYVVGTPNAQEFSVMAPL